MQCYNRRKFLYTVSFRLPTDTPRKHFHYIKLYFFFFYFLPTEKWRTVGFTTCFWLGEGFCVNLDSRIPQNHTKHTDSMENVQVWPFLNRWRCRAYNLRHLNLQRYTYFINFSTRLMFTISISKLNSNINYFRGGGAAVYMELMFLVQKIFF